MNVHVDLDALVEACEWVRVGEDTMTHAGAVVSRSDGSIYWFGDGVEDEPPGDPDDDTAYIPVPNTREFALGRDLAIRYVEEHLPQSLGKVEDYFRRRGMYAKFKSHLHAVGHLEKWHAYESAATEECLTRWAELNGFSVTNSARR